MKSQKEVWRNLKWDKINESREKYYVIYEPIRKIGVNYASLNLYFLSNFTNEEIANLMEKELENWISRYPVPTILFSFDESANDILLGDVKSGNLLLGYLDCDSKNIVKKWGSFGELYSEDIINITDKELNQIYAGLGYKTIEEVEQELDEKYDSDRKIKKIINIIVKSGLFVGIAIETIALRSFCLGLLFYLFEMGKFARKLSGYKTKKQKKMDEMNHYYYHCKKNPSGFLKLKQENIEEESRKRIRELNEKIKNE